MLVQHRLVDGAGVVVQPARDGEVEAVVALRHAQGPHQAEHLPQLGDALGQRGAAGGAGLDRVEAGQRVLVVGGADLDEPQDALDHLRRQAEAVAGQGGAQVVLAPLVELVHLAQHGRLLLAVDDPQVLVEAAQQLAVVDLDGERADGQVGEDRVDDRRALGVVAHRQLVLADDVDVALVELAEPPALRPLAPVDPLHLVAPEREGQLVLVLGDVARQRHGQVEAQRQLGVCRLLAVGGLLTAGLARLLQRAGGLDEVDLALGLAAGLGQQHLGALEDGRLDRQEAEALVAGPDGVQHPLEGHLVVRQELEGSGRRAGRDHARSLRGWPGRSGTASRRC